MAYPDRRFPTPSGKVEFWSERAAGVGLDPLPGYRDSAFTAREPAGRFPLQLGQGRTLTHFHSFYDAGRALPSLARLNQAPELWISHGVRHDETAPGRSPRPTAHATFDGQPLVGAQILGRLISPYDLTERQRFETPFARTLMLATRVAPTWCVPGEFGYIVVDADGAEVLDG